MSDLSATPADADPRSQPNYRIMKAVVILLGVLIVLALVGVVVGFAMKISGHGAGTAAAAGAVYDLPAHSRIVSLQIANQNRVVLGVQTPAGSEIDIFDTESGRLVARIRAPETK